MRIVFMGSPEFALPSLKLLHESSKVEILGVFSQPAKKAGRKMQLKDTKIAEFAKEKGLKLFTPSKITENEVEILKKLNPDLVCVVSYGLIIPQIFLDVCPFINVHPSSLPRFRGAAPLQYALISGDKSSDICIMDVEKGVDTGAVYKRVTYDIPEDMYLDLYHDKMAKEGAKHLLDVVENWKNYQNKAVPQKEEGMIYAHKIDKKMQKIDFSKSVKEVYNLIRGISPVPAAIAVLDGEKFKIYKSEIISCGAHNYKIGEIVKANIKEGLHIACKDGIIRLKTIQKPGKSKMDDTVLLNGYKFIEGSCFE